MKHSSRKHTVKVAVIVVTVSLLVVTAVGANQYFNPNVGFQYLEPGYLPPGVSIKEKRISIYRNQVAAVELNFRTEDWVYSIGEQKAGPRATPGATTILGTANQNYNTSSAKPTCSLLTSPRGQYFRLCHWIDYGRIGAYEVKFVKAGTSIDITMPTTLQQHITVAQISQFVDSFTPKRTFGISVLRSTGA